jgi:hypothetical protein
LLSNFHYPIEKSNYINKYIFKCGFKPVFVAEVICVITAVTASKQTGFSLYFFHKLSCPGISWAAFIISRDSIKTKLFFKIRAPVIFETCQKRHSKRADME